jgi:hypothetical protein
LGGGENGTGTIFPMPALPYPESLSHLKAAYNDDQLTSLMWDELVSRVESNYSALYSYSIHLSETIYYLQEQVNILGNITVSYGWYE